MTVQAREARGWTGRRRRVLAALLALAILIPLGALFLDHIRDKGGHASAAVAERDGIEYLLALGQLTIALTGAQSAAISGEPVAREQLDGAVADVAEVDGRLGEELRVRERWSQLRDTIELAAGTEPADGRAAFAAYSEATSLLLGLHDRLRETTGLVREPEPDAHHLQDAAGGRLPEVIVMGGRLADLVTIAVTQPAANPLEISVAADAVTGPVEDFVAGIQAALDSTDSRSLSSSILSQYDRFLRAKDGLLLAATPGDGETGGDPANVDPGQLGFSRAEFQDAADDLSVALLTELDTLVESRASALTRSRWTAAGWLAAGVLLALALVAVSLVRDARQPTRHRRPAELTARSGDDVLGDRGGSGHGSPQLPRPLIPLTGMTDGYDPGPGIAPARGRFAGELLDPERADVR